MKTPTRSNNNLLSTRVASSQAGTIGLPPQRERVFRQSDALEPSFNEVQPTDLLDR